MSRKIVSLFTLIAFIVFSISCYMTKIKNVRTAADLRGKKGEILSLVKTSGEYIYFSKNSPGRIYGDKIAGTAFALNKKVEITRDNIKEVKRDKKGMISEITNKDGKRYEVIIGTAREEENKIIFSYELYESVSIPLSEVKSAQVKKPDYAKFSLVVLGVVGLAILTIVSLGSITAIDLGM